MNHSRTDFLPGLLLDVAVDLEETKDSYGFALPVHGHQLQLNDLSVKSLTSDQVSVRAHPVNSRCMSAYLNLESIEL